MKKIISTLMTLVLAGCVNFQNPANISSNLQGTENKREIHLTEYGKTIKLADPNIYANFVPKEINRENIPYQIIKVTMENPGLYTYTKWIDENNNEVRDRSELQGMVKTSFNLGEEPIKLLFSNKDYTGNLTLKTWSGSLIQKTQVMPLLWD